MDCHCWSNQDTKSVSSWYKYLRRDTQKRPHRLFFTANIIFPRQGTMIILMHHQDANGAGTECHEPCQFGVGSGCICPISFDSMFIFLLSHQGFLYLADIRAVVLDCITIFYLYVCYTYASQRYPVHALSSICLSSPWCSMLCLTEAAIF